jgi:uncharacterized protein YceK
MRILSLLILTIVLAGCQSSYPADTPSIKYGNREAAGSRLNFGGDLFVPDKMNILYFYADW